jgi:hypothetical protein
MSSITTKWEQAAIEFLMAQCTNHGATSVPGGPITLYGTCYAWLGLFYLGHDEQRLKHAFKDLIVTTRDPCSGYYNGPELVNYNPRVGVLHDKRHLQVHLTCSAVLPVAQEMGISLLPLSAAYDYCNPDFLRDWTESIDWTNAWFEGNNILFVGQLLIYLRDVESSPKAGDSLRLWFDWLDSAVDLTTGIWGTDSCCSTAAAVYGGYHQLLVYYHENHPLPNIHGLVDTVLSLQHEDGGFNPNGNAGACEDVDSVDILVNCYKRVDYRRSEIRSALRKCLSHILATQNQDGGFPYNLNQPQSHMGIPGTEAGPNVSCTFPTWFRIHTLALIAEVLPNASELSSISFQFNKSLSMGWHRSPSGWHQNSLKLFIGEQIYRQRRRLSNGLNLVRKEARRTRSGFGKALKRSGIR